MAKESESEQLHRHIHSFIGGRKRTRADELTNPDTGLMPDPRVFTQPQSVNIGDVVSLMKATRGGKNGK